jgi:hypothetical protein
MRLKSSSLGSSALTSGGSAVYVETATGRVDVRSAYSTVLRCFFLAIRLDVAQQL